jgi:DUF4097 and DUF4098 domain-containing protein YvlB
MMKKINLVLVIGLLLSQSIFSAEINKKIEQKLNLSKSGKLRVENQFGNIHVESWDKNEASLVLDIRVKTRKEKDAKKIIEQIKLDIKKRGSFVNVKLDDFEWDFDEFKGSIELNYTINCHESVALELNNQFGNITALNFKSIVMLNNSNGNIEARNHARLEAHNRFGNIEVADVTGSAMISNSNGNVDVRQCKSKTAVNNSFGDTWVHDCTGVVEVNSKNGNLEIRNIEDGKLSCANQFGNSEILNIDGDAKVNSRNGSIRIEKINGNGKIRNSFGETNAKEITGNLDIYSENGRIKIDNVKGYLKVSNSFGENIVENINGTTEIYSSNGKIVLTNAMEPIEITNSFASTILSDVNPKIQVETGNGKVRINNLKKGFIDIEVNNSFAEIEVELPTGFDGAQFYETEFGRITHEGLKPLDMKATMINKAGKTKENIKLITSNGNIKITEK